MRAKFGVEARDDTQLSLKPNDIVLAGRAATRARAGCWGARRAPTTRACGSSPRTSSSPPRPPPRLRRLRAGTRRARANVKGGMKGVLNSARAPPKRRRTRPRRRRSARGGQRRSRHNHEGPRRTPCSVYCLFHMAVPARANEIHMCKVRFYVVLYGRRAVEARYMAIPGRRAMPFRHDASAGSSPRIAAVRSGSQASWVSSRSKRR